MIHVDDVKVAEGGLENLTVATLDLNLNLKQISTNKTFNIISKKIRGSGKTKENAIDNALTQIKPTERTLLNFIVDGKDKIYQYFNDNCSNIITDAKNARAKNNYAKAISMAQSIPNTGNTCYEEAQNMATKYYLDYQQILCKTNVTKAKAEIARNNFEDAYYFLHQIDASSSCNNEVEELIKKVSDKVDRYEEREYNLEEKRIDAIKEIAKSYYETTVTHYVFEFN